MAGFLCTITFGLLLCNDTNTQIEKRILPNSDIAAFDTKQIDIKPDINATLPDDKAKQAKPVKPKVIEKEVIKEVFVDKPVVVQKEVIREVDKPVYIELPPPGLPPKPNFYHERLATIDKWDDIEIINSQNSFGALAKAKDTDKLKNIAINNAKYTAPFDKAGLPVKNDFILTQDRYIIGILENGINSQLPGTIIIQVSQNVFGYHGNNILIPKGSRLICKYENADAQGVSRLQTKCNRILMGESRAEINNLESDVSDVQGRVGIAGEIDNRFFEKYGLAFMLAGVSVGTRIGTATIANKGSSSNNQGTNNTSPINQAVDDGAKELSQKFGEITAQSLQESLQIKPIISVSKGTRVQIRPAKDWIITTN